jgi:D-alanyl-D-alanine dipeptidase
MRIPSGFLKAPSEITDLVVPDVDPIPGISEGLEEIAVEDNGEPLVVLPAQAVFPIYVKSGWLNASSEMRLRQGASEALGQASTHLPQGYDLCVLDAWRSNAFQRDLHSFYTKEGELDEDYVADPGDQMWIAPHTTGGAVDLTLAWMGEPLMLGTDFDDFTPEAWTRSLEDSDGDLLGRDLRRVLFHAMTAADFAPYPFEWWHFSYGDQCWAQFFGKPNAIYGRVAG